MDQGLVERLAVLASSAAQPIASMSMEQIAGQLGMTRMTLYRKAGSRQEILAALEAHGVDVGSEPMVRERVIDAAAAILREQPIASLTLEAVAERAACSLPSIYDQFGGRQGVLRAVFEQHSPLLTLERLVASEPWSAEPDLAADVRRLYGAIFDQVTVEWPILRAFVAEMLRDPESDVGVLFREWYAPRAIEAIMPVLSRHIERGAFRPLPPPLIVQEFVGPFMLHIATRNRLVEALGGELPDRDATVELFTGMFCRAVAAAPAPESDRPEGEGAR